MPLLEVVRNLELLDEDDTIYAARPWSPTADALVAKEPEAGGLPKEARDLDFDYFLEVFLALEFLRDLHNSHSTAPELKAQCERLIRYAQTDA